METLDPKEQAYVASERARIEHADAALQAERAQIEPDANKAILQYFASVNSVYYYESTRFLLGQKVRSSVFDGSYACSPYLLADCASQALLLIAEQNAEDHISSDEARVITAQQRVELERNLKDLVHTLLSDNSINLSYCEPPFTMDEATIEKINTFKNKVQKIAEQFMLEQSTTYDVRTSVQRFMREVSDSAEDDQEGRALIAQIMQSLLEQINTRCIPIETSYEEPKTDETATEYFVWVLKSAEDKKKNCKERNTLLTKEADKLIADYPAHFPHLSPR
ncbi:MAG: hypothetical protein COU32_02945 [Candidatus Magasanikbacteria bacterium CG10_big_fil_rev_8_21_14_0_10_42_10]|uniref:Uncharacterized protein n=1 Tax=Candidatus Magasanikbacteria bacterium CG10_big_fil_rev_8_21_14_0_10_42_10 TaxID=1974649 RepID=A0A2H0TXQ4_9BACT|nr:MAG: hypothetical protein COU32_02945 [Candidatus Magasanikbacteria bacterium CG10_big_fil_rev_8_21_14_0_10_42_10]